MSDAIQVEEEAIGLDEAPEQEEEATLEEQIAEKLRNDGALHDQVAAATTTFVSDMPESMNDAYSGTCTYQLGDFITKVGPAIVAYAKVIAPLLPE